MRGLALEGGGSRGAFHIGAFRAFLENGYTFDAVTGTSIGAINGAMIAQGDYELLYKLWGEINTETLFDISNEQMAKIFARQLDMNSVAYLSSKAKELIANKGFDTGKIRAMLDMYIDEERLRNSPMGYGLVTVSLNDFQPQELLKEDIPEGQLKDYIMASANLPVFRVEPSSDKKRFLDGGVYNNCPVNLLLDMGCKQIVEVRTMAIGHVLKYDETGLEVMRVFPSEDLGYILNFDPALVQYNLKMGYFDALRAIKGYKGKLYYVDTEVLAAPSLGAAAEANMLLRLATLPESVIYRINHTLGISGDARGFFEKTLPQMARVLKLESDKSYLDLIVAILEEIHLSFEVNRFAVVGFDDFLRQGVNMLSEHSLDVWLNSGKAGLLGQARHIAMKKAMAMLIRGLSMHKVSLVDKTAVKAGAEVNK